MAKYKSQSEKQEIACPACRAEVSEPCRTDESASDRSARHKAWKRWSARNSAVRGLAASAAAGGDGPGSGPV